MSKTKTPPVNRAVAVIRRPKRTDAQKVSLTQTIAAAMAASPSWPQATDLQAAVKVWSADAGAIDANAKAITALREQLKTALAHQNALRSAWGTSTAHVLSTATVFCAGSVETVQSLALDVESHARHGALGVVAGLAVNPGKGSGEVVASWLRGNASRGFVVQHASDAGNPATYATPTPWTKTRFTLGGLATNAAVSFRVAAIDPTSATGTGPWTAWVLGNAR
jgi:hypothetical protein